MLQTVLSVLVVLVAIVRFIPQVVRIVREGTSAGVSFDSYGFVLVHAAMYGVYGYWLNDIPLMVPTPPVVIVSLLTMRLLIRDREGVASVHRLVFWCLFAVIIATFCYLLVPAITPILVAPFLAAAPIRQLWWALRSSDVQGVTIPGWILSAAVSGTWMLYGFSIGEPIAVAFSFVTLPAEASVAAVVWHKRKGTIPVISEKLVEPSL